MMLEIALAITLIGSVGTLFGVVGMLHEQSEAERNR
jgi:hypothetical protein